MLLSTSWAHCEAVYKRAGVHTISLAIAVSSVVQREIARSCALREYVAKPEVYVVNEGANTLDTGRNVLEMRSPRKRLDCGTWGVMGVGMGYAIAAAVVSGKPVVAVEGDSAFGFNGMEIETICRYHLPIVVVVLNNGGIYRGDDINRSGGSDPAPTVLMKQARYDKLIEAFDGKCHYAADTQTLTRSLTDALASGQPALIDCSIDPTREWHIRNLNPQARLEQTGASR
jgi:oxalyl-CoA decarboxylase